MKHCLMQDDSSHWYCIPIEYKEKFDNWAYSEDEEIYEFDFDQYRLNMHISNYCFENFEEIKK